MKAGPLVELQRRLRSSSSLFQRRKFLRNRQTQHHSDLLRLLLAGGCFAGGNLPTLVCALKVDLQRPLLFITGRIWLQVAAVPSLVSWLKHLWGSMGRPPGCWFSAGEVQREAVLCSVPFWCGLSTLWLQRPCAGVEKPGVAAYGGCSTPVASQWLKPDISLVSDLACLVPVWPFMLTSFCHIQNICWFGGLTIQLWLLQQLLNF